FLVRMPDMQSFWHLHPRQTSEGNFAVDLPALAAGHYQIFADIVHHTGFPETQVGEIDLPALSGSALSGDDAGDPDLAPSATVSQLRNGDRMVWGRDSSPIKANVPVWFRFRVEDKDGRPATGMENYMGMAGHAAFNQHRWQSLRACASCRLGFHGSGNDGPGRVARYERDAISAAEPGSFISIRLPSPR